jgi:uncharacterized membrane protein
VIRVVVAPVLSPPAVPSVAAASVVLVAVVLVAAGPARVVVMITSVTEASAVITTGANSLDYTVLCFLCCAVLLRPTQLCTWCVSAFLCDLSFLLICS